jgi:hypothetical protein
MGGARHLMLTAQYICNNLFAYFLSILILTFNLSKERAEIMIPYNERQQKLIVNNVVRAVKDIFKLNKTGYNFLYQASGFIAHYDLTGFKDYYEQHDLKADILKNQRMNQWNNFHPGENYYDYMMSKKAIYNAIVRRLTEKE